MTAYIAPGPKGSFLLGSLRDLQRDPLAFFEHVQREYGGIARLRLGPRRAYLVSDPEYVREVLVSQARIVPKTNFIREQLGRFLGNGILTNEGDSHRRQRRLVQPAFNHQKIARYAGSMVTLTAKMLDGWKVGHSYDIDEEMMHLTMEIIAETAFGTEVDGVFQRVADAIAVLQAISIIEFKAGYMLPEWVPTANNRRRKKAAKVMSDTVLTFIRERRASGEERDDLLSMLLQAQDEDDGSVMTDEQVRDEAVTLFAAGHETTSNAMTWTWYLLAQHPQVEAALHEELDRVLGDRPPTLADLRDLPYTEMVVKEALRLYPPAWLLMSRTPSEPLTLGGVAIKPGEWIFVAPWVIHRNPDQFPDPARFDPGRFAPGEEDQRPRYAYLPFGGGPHVCIGNGFAMMEARLILATVAQRYRLALDPGQTVVPEPEITLRPRYGMHMTVQAR